MLNIPSYLRIQIGGIMALLIVAYGLADYLLLPSYNNLQETETEIGRLRTCAENLGGNLIELKNCEKKLHEHRAHLDDCFDSMESESLDPLEWLQNVSNRSGVKILSFQDQRNGVINALPAVDIDMKAKGNYEQICLLLHHLERSSRPCFISRFHVQQSSGAEDSLDIEARFLVFPISKGFQELLSESAESKIASSANPTQREIPTP